MKEIAATLTSKGQVTIPVEIRKHLDIKTHDKVAFVIADDGSVTLTVPRYPTVASLQGAAGSLSRSRTWQEMREIARGDAMTKQGSPEA